MRAVNLIPADSRRRGGSSGPPQFAVYAVLGALAVAVALVTMYVLTTNSISERRAKLASLQGQVAQANTEAARLQKYAAFEQLARQRVDTIRQIAATRFDWHAALSDLSKVVPANTSLASLSGTVAPGASVSGGSAGGGSTGGLRSDIAVPAFELSGCTSTQDDVARLMSRLRLMNGVTRVTLADSQKQVATGAGAAVSSASSASGTCGANTPSFDLVVFFSPLSGAAVQAAGATGASSTPGTPVTPATPTMPATSPGAHR